MNTKETSARIIADGTIGGAIVEMGSGPVIQYELSTVPGASAVLQEGLFPNSKESQISLGKGEAVRSVSREAVLSILEHVSKSRPEYRTTLVSSWQIPSGETRTDTHGWIALRQNDRVRTFHASLSPLVDNVRERAQAKIAELGLALLEAKNTDVPLPYLGLDVLRDETAERNEAWTESEFLQKAAEILALRQFESLDESTEHVLFFDSKLGLARPTDILRKREELAIFKGSFNPVTVWHLGMAQTYEKATGVRPTFAISVRTVDKGTNGAGDLWKRITLIRNLGYDVFVFGQGLFTQNTETIRNLGYAKSIGYVCGTDTLARVTDEELATLHGNGATLWELQRHGDGSNVPKQPKIRPYAERIEWEWISGSSTQVRNREGDWKKLIPETNASLYERLYCIW